MVAADADGDGRPVALAPSFDPSARRPIVSVSTATSTRPWLQAASTPMPTRIRDRDRQRRLRRGRQPGRSGGQLHGRGTDRDLPQRGRRLVLSANRPDGNRRGTIGIVVGDFNGTNTTTWPCSPRSTPTRSSSATAMALRTGYRGTGRVLRRRDRHWRLRRRRAPRPRRRRAPGDGTVTILAAMATGLHAGRRSRTRIGRRSMRMRPGSVGDQANRRSRPRWPRRRRRHRSRRRPGLHDPVAGRRTLTKSAGPPELPEGSAPLSVAVGDLNADGIPGRGDVEHPHRHGPAFCSGSGNGDLEKSTSRCRPARCPQKVVIADSTSMNGPI